MQINESKLEAFMGRLLQEMGAAMNVGLVNIGDQLGLYKAMTCAGWLTAAELAEKTATDLRYIREWLSAQVAGQFVDYDPSAGKFRLPDEHAMALAVEDSPCNVAGAYNVIASTIKDQELIAGAFRTGRGVGWHEHHHSLFAGTDRFFRAGYRAHLIQEWLPALDGVAEKLNRGAMVADVGCGLGSSTLLMAEAFPQSRFFGFDYHDGSIEAARRKAVAVGVNGDRLTFEVASAKAFPGSGYSLITVFDSLHDMGDPVGAARHIRQALSPDGVFMIVEPFAHDKLEDNINPVGRMYYSASTMVCTPGSRAQEVGLALGAQAGEEKIRDVVMQAGFTRFRRATQTPFNLVFEARP